MESFDHLVIIKNNLEYLDYKNKASLIYVRKAIKDAIEYIGVMELALGFTAKDEVKLLKKDLRLLSERSNPKDGFDDCMKDLIPDLESVIDLYYRLT